MEINLLVLNVGNTRLALGAFADSELTYTNRIELDRREDLQGAIVEAWAKVNDPDADVVAASVNPALNEIVEHLAQQATGKPVQWVGQQIDLPIAVKTAESEKTGVDRVLNVAAAYELMQKACVVVDAGTAITVNVCDDEGNFLGGAIAPGATVMLKAMHEHTAKLPEVKLAVPDGLIGVNTEQAMLHGVYHGIRGMVKELAESYAMSLGNWPEIICTGGDAKTLFGGWELIHAVSPDLTLHGIALAYTEHHIKHGT
jgi:type III pantothenate kinase